MLFGLRLIALQTYKTHLDGKLHKKKLQQSQIPTPAGAGVFTCELCDVTCTSKDAFEAHIRGSKHQKVGLYGYIQHAN